MRRKIDAWPVNTAGLSARSVTCLSRAGIQTIGELQAWDEQRLLALPAFGNLSLRDVRWFFDWTKRLETGGELPVDLRAFLTEFLTARQLNVIEQRYGLTDPLFRPWMKQATLREIGGERRGGITRERVRQIEAEAIARLRSELAQAVAKPLRRALVNQPRGAPVLGGYEPWGAVWMMEQLYDQPGS